MDNSGSIAVRFAKRGELEAVNVLRRQVNDLHVSGRPDIFRDGFVPELEQHIYERFDDPSSAVIAAFCEGTLCGFATVEYKTKPLSPYSLERKIYQVEEFGVDEAFRRKGAGRALVEFMKNDAAQKGYDRMELDMWEFNEGALAFYEAVGFVTYRRYMELNINGYPARENAEKLLCEAEGIKP